MTDLSGDLEEPCGDIEPCRPIPSHLPPKKPKYEFEDIREFIVRRTWLAEEHSWSKSRPLVSPAEYPSLKKRTLRFSPERAAYLRAFIDGWTRAKG